MEFNSSNLAAIWKKWRKNMGLYLTAMMRGKSEEENYSVFLFLIGEQGKDVLAFLYKKNFYNKMSLKNPQHLRKC